MKTCFYFGIALLLAGCSSVQATYDYDKNTDFSKYQTYAFTEESKMFSGNELVRNRILSAIDNEMVTRGYKKSESPDVFIDLHGRLEEKRDATATTSGGGYYGGAWRYGYGGGFTTTHIDVNEYIEGTLFINLVDRQTDKLVWQGRGTKTLDEHASAEKMDKNVSYAIKKIFENYPVKPISTK